MSNLAIVYLHLDFDLSYDDFEATREYLINVTGQYSSVIYRQNSNVRVELRDGSVKAWILVAGSIYLAIGQYGSFRSGVDQVIKDAKSVKEFITDTLVKDGVDESRVIEAKRKRCLPDKIRRLFLRIDRFEERIANMSPAEKAREAELITRVAEGISYELDYQEDLDQFLSCLDDRFKPAPESLKLKYHTAIRKEGDFMGRLVAPYKANELLIEPPRGFESSSAKKALQLTSAPLALRNRN
ncbi:hypothetical protein [Salinicola endophyticus]|uniref:hypothetical protein n=1 Tax=Salinicola endophyticus TaxID=1949083 RepID=UPI0013008E13|nr:hypothetical protein [Salinicola endophyticus]